MASVIDLSRYQAGISLGAIARDGHDAVIIKATQGSGYVSSALTEQVRAARSAGLPVGLYHFCDGSDPAAQARHFLTVAGPLVRIGAEPLVFDFEGNGATHGGLDVMRRIVRAAGHRTATYTGGYWDSAGSSSCAECAADPLWLASYRSTQPAPKRPWTRIALWQRTDAARVTGWAAGVDMSTTDDLTPMFGPPTEDDMTPDQATTLANAAADAHNAATIASEVRNWIVDPARGLLAQVGQLRAAQDPTVLAKAVSAAVHAAGKDIDVDALAKAIVLELGAQS